VSQVDGLVVHHHVGRAVVKHRRDVLPREGVGHQQARLAHGSVTHHHTLNRLHRHFFSFVLCWFFFFFFWYLAGWLGCVDVCLFVMWGVRQ